jgi:hypothetical protein
MKLKKLPIGIQTFSNIREDDYLYIDKTKEAYELIDNYKYAFLSRPRRFGKSLFLDTLRNIFEGKKELFEGLYIYDMWDWSQKYPVIKISWDGRLRSVDDLERRAKEVFNSNQTRLGIECEDSDYMPNCLEQLIKESYKKYNQKVVILIDEYDRPILDVIDNIQQAKEHREYIKGLYSIIKGCDEYIKFAFLTGVSKFSKASIFSGLNMLTDISLRRKFGNICGYTQDDIESILLPYLDGVDLNKLKNWYNGYNFLKDEVYNPFDILRFIDNNYKFSNYWFESGTPTFLIKLIEQNSYFLPKLSNLVVGEELINSFDIENINFEVILYQAGYLTIDEMIVDEEFDFIEYRLKLPNKEVRHSLNQYIISALYKDTSTQNKKLLFALAKSDLKEFENAFKSIFASIPYNNFTNSKMQNYEGFYASVVYVYLQSLGVDIIGEDVTNLGQIDLTVKIKNLIYIIEFKVGDEDALSQIKDKNYQQKYLQSQKEIYLVGINFCKEKKNISKLEWERCDSRSSLE